MGLIEDAYASTDGDAFENTHNNANNMWKWIAIPFYNKWGNTWLYKYTPLLNSHEKKINSIYLKDFIIHQWIHIGLNWMTITLPVTKIRMTMFAIFKSETIAFFCKWIHFTIRCQRITLFSLN
eukprot:NODE_131_length_16689_cov_0.437914.p14 type:complete len:123 gc:universal NODE_131_length_16689_cov_0.437914:1610-1978(+)